MPCERAHHKSVLAQEVLTHLSPVAGGTFLDGTFGAGGHTQFLLENRASAVFAIDQDPSVAPFHQDISKRFSGYFHFFQGNFSELEKLLPNDMRNNFDGALFDLGVSSMQLDQDVRGFSFMRDGPLDMRMSQKGLSAADLLQDISETDLADLLFIYGEERRSRIIAKGICQQRKKTPFTTTMQLSTFVSDLLGGKKGKKHPATQTFQALRIYVNKELEILSPAIAQVLSFLKEGGRLAIITFHSLEDRLIKRVFKHYAEENQLVIATKKPIIPTREEILSNPRARSAKLRVAIKKGGY